MKSSIYYFAVLLLFCLILAWFLPSCCQAISDAATVIGFKLPALTQTFMTGHLCYWPYVMASLCMTVIIVAFARDIKNEVLFHILIFSLFTTLMATTVSAFVITAPIFNMAKLAK